MRKRSDSTPHPSPSSQQQTTHFPTLTMKSFEGDITIAGSVSICLQSFEKCLGSTTPLHPRERALIEDQFGRFSAWTANAAALAPGRASMDHRLREADEALSMVVGLLDAFNDRIQLCMLQLSIRYQSTNVYSGHTFLVSLLCN